MDWPWWIPVCFAGLALVVGVGAVAQRSGLWPPGFPAGLALVAVAPWLVQLLTGRHVPNWLFFVVVNAAVAGLMLWRPVGIDLAPLLLLLLLGDVAATERVRVSLSYAAVSAAMVVGLQVAGAHQLALFWSVCLLAAWDIGFVMQWQMRLVEQERVAAASRVQRATAEERQRIAREVHDVIAHSLSVTMLHLTAARRSLEEDGETDVAEAVDALRDAERLGRQSMADIRRTVGLLGSGGRLPPEPDASQIADLVGDYRSAGLEVTYQLRGDPAAVSAATGLGLYRIVQESLANVAKHAPHARSEASLDLTGPRYRLTIWNDLPGATGKPHDDGGSGLTGMRERCELLGGTFHAGPEDTGWLVRAEVPGSGAVVAAAETAPDAKECAVGNLLGRHGAAAAGGDVPSGSGASALNRPVEA
ncbi:MAG: two-component sensor histidine kinase [Micromonosporaceae bacterium]|nr:two-component sensor histidine kinase [Micromonosporaceae bacterium]